MKNLMFYATFAVVSVLCVSCEDETVNPDKGLSVSNPGAPVVPVITAQYSIEEIAEMIRLFNISRENNVVPPTELQQKFKTDFPNVYDVEWEFGADIYEVEFEIAYRDYDAYYDRQGVLLMYVTELMLSELPEAVKNAVSARYYGYRIEDIDRINIGTDIFYRIELENGNIELTVSLKPDGTLI